MDTSIELKAGIKNNKGKAAVLILYVFFIFISPLYALTPIAQKQFISFMNSLISPEADKFFRQYIDLLRKGETDQAYSLIAEQVRQSVSPELLKALSTHFTNTTDQMQVIGWKYKSFTMDGNTLTTYDVHYEIQNNDSINKYMIAEFNAQNTGSGFQILGVHEMDSAQAVKEVARFNLASQWVYIMLSLLIPLIIIYTGIRYIQKAQSPKWILFLIILFATVYPNVSGQQYNINFGAYGFMAKAGPYAPWVFLTPIPLGTIYYYIFRKKYENI